MMYLKALPLGFDRKHPDSLSPSTLSALWLVSPRKGEMVFSPPMLAAVEGMGDIANSEGSQPEL